MYLFSVVAEQWVRTSCPGKYLPPPKFCDSLSGNFQSPHLQWHSWQPPLSVKVSPHCSEWSPRGSIGPVWDKNPILRFLIYTLIITMIHLGRITISFRLFWEFTINLNNLYRRQNHIFWCFSTRGTNHPTFVLGHLPIRTLSIYLCGYLLPGPRLSWLWNERRS